MSTSKNFFSGYCRSKNFLDTITALVGQATCAKRPWTIKGSGNNYAINYSQAKHPYICISHEHISGEVFDIVIADMWNVPSPQNNKYGSLQVRLYPESTFLPSDPIACSASNDQTYLFSYHGGNASYTDLDQNPQFVWYWAWIDDDVFVMSVLGNQGGAGSAPSLASTIFMGDGHWITTPHVNTFSEWPNYPCTFCVFTNDNTVPYIGSSRNAIYNNVISKNTAMMSWSINHGNATRFYDPLFNNSVANSFVPRMTSNTTPAGAIAFDSGINSASCQPFRAFDGRLNTCWETYASVGVAYLAVELAAAKIATNYAVSTDYTYKPTGWLFQGSNDAINWATLDTRTDQFIETISTVKTPIQTYYFTNSIPYKYYRLKPTASYTTPMRVFTFAIGNAEAPAIQAYAVGIPVFSSLAQNLYSKQPIEQELGNGQVLLTHNGPKPDLLQGDIIAVEEQKSDYVYTSTSAPSPWTHVLVKRAESAYDIIASNVTNSSCRITWTNPLRLSGVKVVRKVATGNPDLFSMAQVTDGTVVHDNNNAVAGATSYFDDSGLSSQTVYEYMVVAYDSNGVHSVPIRDAKVHVTTL
jgi:hypothetical protein